MMEPSIKITTDHFKRLAVQKFKRIYFGQDWWLILAALKFTIAANMKESGLVGDARKYTIELEKDITKIFA